MNSFIEVTNTLLIAQTSTSSYCHLNKFQDENKTNLFDQRHGLKRIGRFSASINFSIYSSLLSLSSSWSSWSPCCRSSCLPRSTSTNTGWVLPRLGFAWKRFPSFVAAGICLQFACVGLWSIGIIRHRFYYRIAKIILEPINNHICTYAHMHICTYAFSWVVFISSQMYLIRDTIPYQFCRVFLMLFNSFLNNVKKHRKNCNCCNGNSLTVSH